MVVAATPAAGKRQDFGQPPPGPPNILSSRGRMRDNEQRRLDFSMRELEALIAELALPLAQLLRRALHSHAPFELHHNAYYVAEASLKLAASARVGLWLERALEPGSPIATRLEALVLPSLGQWRDLLRDIDRDLGRRAERTAWPLGACLGNLAAEQPGWRAVQALSRVAVEAGAVSDDIALSVERDGLLGFFNLVVSYRNRVIAHGGQRVSSYYDRMGQLWIDALAEVLSHDGILGGQRLAYARLSLPQRGSSISLYWQALHGVSSAELGEPEAPPPDRNVAGRVCLVGSLGAIGLHPLVVYRIDETGNESFAFLNRTVRHAGSGHARGDEIRRADYLDYATGENLTGTDTRAELTALLGKLRGAPATAEDLRAAQDASLAETDGAPEPTLVPLGTVGDFDILEEIGRGGMGVVYRAEQRSVHRAVALKVLSAPVAGDPAVLRRFRREVAALARCDHPNVIRVLTSGIDADRYYHAMELVDGADIGKVTRVLRDWKRRGMALRPGHLRTAVAVAAACGEDIEAWGTRTSLPPPEEGSQQYDDAGRDYFRRVAELFAGAAMGLDHLHARGVVHRDVKPSNLLLTTGAARVMIMDLGLARLRDASQSASKDESHVLGTLRYAAPEQLLGRHADVDHRADVYALGASLYELVTGRPMFDAETESRLVRQILYESPPPARQIDPRIPSDLAVILSVATARDPSSRYATAGWMAQDLRAFAAGRRLPIASTSRSLALLGAIRARPARAAGIAAAVMLAAVLGVAAWLHYAASVQLCASVVRRWEVWECSGAVSGSEQPHRSVTYRFRAQRGRLGRVDRVNGAGALVDDDAGEARWEWSWAEGGRMGSMSAFDRTGALRYRLVVTPDLSRMERRDGADNPKPEEGSEVCVFHLELDANGYRRRVRFYNVYGYPMPNADRVFGIAFAHNDHGQPVGMEYLGENGEPGPTRSGIVQERIARDDRGNEIERMHLNAAGNPTTDRNGVFGVRTRYDAHDNPIEQVWLAADGRPTFGPDGVAGFRAWYDEHGNRVAQRTIDVDGNLAWHADGHTGWHGRYDGEGRLIEKVYEDERGLPAVTRSGCAVERTQPLTGHQGFEQSCFDAAGAPAMHRDGYVRKRTLMDEAGRVSSVRFLDAAGAPLVAREGHAGWNLTYDARSNPTSLVFVGVDGQPIQSVLGYAGWRAEHDERGDQAQVTYLGPALRAARNPNGYARVRTLYNSRGDILESAFFDELERPAATSDGYAMIRRQTDRRGNPIEESYWGVDGGPALHRRGYFLVRMRYDDQGRRTEETYYGLDGRPHLARDGTAGWRVVRDAFGRELRRTYLDIDGQPVCGSDGYAMRTLQYDDHGRLAKTTYFDSRGGRGPAERATERRDFDDRGRIVSVSFESASGSPQPGPHGFARVRRLVDDAGRSFGVECVSPDGSVRIAPEPYCAAAAVELEETSW